MEETNDFLNSARTRELWIFIKAELAKKAGVSDLADLVDDDTMANAIATALTQVDTKLTDYAKKSDLQAALSGALTRAVVDSLPSVYDGDPTVIYFVPSEGTDDSNIKDEYMLVNGAWELIGTTRVDLSGYWSKDQLRAMTAAELSAILV